MSNIEFDFSQAFRNLLGTTGRCKQEPVQLHDKATVEHFTEKDMVVAVKSPPDGFFCTLSMKGKVPLPPEEVYEILTDINNVSIFRSIKKVKNRKILTDDGRRLRAEVEHLAKWQLGFLKGTFTIKLLVEQDRHDKSINFRLSNPKGFMKDFTGQWRIRPFTQDVLDEEINWPGRHWGPFHSLKTAVHSIEDKMMQKKIGASLVELEQSVAPKYMPPPPIDSLLRRISAQQIKHIMDDLNKEAQRRLKIKA